MPNLELSKCPRCGSAWVPNYNNNGFMCPNVFAHLAEDGQNLFKRLLKYGMEP